MPLILENTTREIMLRNYRLLHQQISYFFTIYLGANYPSNIFIAPLLNKEILASVTTRTRSKNAVIKHCRVRVTIKSPLSHGIIHVAAKDYHLPSDFRRIMAFGGVLVRYAGCKDRIANPQYFLGE